MSRMLRDEELTAGLDVPVDPAIPYDEWPVRPGYPGDCREGDPAFYRVMLPCCDRPLGIHLGHTWHEAGVLLRMVELVGIARFVEIGVHAGGLAALLVARTLVDADFSYLGVELNPALVASPVKRLIAGLDSHFASLAYGDCFSDEMKRHIAAFAYRDAERVLFYCDNGDKSEEIKAYASMPRPGDILALHDYWEPGMEVRDLPEFGPLERGGRPFPGPEVVPSEVAFLEEVGFKRMEPEVWTPNTRIAAYVRV